MRGVTVPCTTLVDALEKFACDEICKGNALFILAEREFVPEQLAALIRASKGATLSPLPAQLTETEESEYEEA